MAPFVQQITLKVVIVGLLRAQLWAYSKLPSFGADSETGEPLDFVIPTWETFWRVVATCLAEVQGRPNLAQIMKDFVENPTNEQFSSNGTNGISVEFIILETLRLHPPVQRISRVVEKSVPKYLAVLPESIQSPDIFGDDAEVFSPSRFYGQPDLTKIADLAFGHGPIQCVAAKWAKRAAALLAASLLNHLDSHTYRIVRGDKIGGRDGWEGWVVEMRHPE